MTPIKAKAGDAIRIDKQLSEGSTRTSGPLDLTGKTVRVYVQYEEDAIVANTEVEYVDREQGQVAIELAPSQTSNIGRHSIEWVVDPQTDPTTYPADGYDTLETVSPLDRELTPTTDVPPDLTVTNLTVEGDVALGGGNLTGVETLDATSLDADGASVTSAPTANTDVVRKQEAELKADLTAPDGVLQSSQVPDLSITETFTVTDEAARLSLNVQEGDVAIQTSNNTTYIFTGGDPAVNSNWSTIQLDVLEAIDGSDITPSSVTAQSVNTEELGTNGFQISNRSDKTISSGSISVSENELYARVAAESGSSDTLSTINGTGLQFIILRPSGDSITVDSADNIELDSGSNVTLSAGADRLVLFSNLNGDFFIELSRSIQ